MGRTNVLHQNAEIRSSTLAADMFADILPATNAYSSSKEIRDERLSAASLESRYKRAQRPSLTRRYKRLRTFSRYFAGASAVSGLAAKNYVLHSNVETSALVEMGRLSVLH